MLRGAWVLHYGSARARISGVVAHSDAYRASAVPGANYRNRAMLDLIPPVDPLGASGLLLFFFRRTSSARGLQISGLCPSDSTDSHGTKKHRDGMVHTSAASLPCRSGKSELSVSTFLKSLSHLHFPHFQTLLCFLQPPTLTFREIVSKVPAGRS